MVALRFDGLRFQPLADALYKAVAKGDDVLAAAVIINQLIFSGVILCDKLLHIFGLCALESVNGLVVITHRNHTHFFVFRHQRLHQFKLVGIHILRFINHQHAFGDAVRLHFVAVDFVYGLTDNGLRFI